MTEPELIKLLEEERLFTLILRGIPGSGKTRLARRLVAALQRDFPKRAVGVASADKFMPNPFDARRLHECHKMAFRHGVLLAHQGSVIVDNTNLRAVEIASWYMTHEVGFSSEDRFVMVLEVPSAPAVAFARQLHGVPSYIHETMVKRFHDRRDFLPAWRIEQLEPEKS